MPEKYTVANFSCTNLKELNFSFPVFKSWTLREIVPIQDNMCGIILNLSPATKVMNIMDERLVILVVKSNQTGSITGKIKKQGLIEQKLPYNLYDDNKLILDLNNDEKIIIRVDDLATFGDKSGRSVAHKIPVEQYGFDYELFWKIVIASLKV